MLSVVTVATLSMLIGSVPGCHLRHESVAMMSAGDEMVSIDQPTREPSRNVIGTDLQCCCADVSLTICSAMERANVAPS